MRDFASPPLEFAPLLSWLWNDSLQPDDICAQLRGAREADFGGVLLRPGAASVPYLSDEWIDLVRVAARESRDLQLQFWLGDDNREPSGNCEGRLTRERPDLRAHFLKFHLEDVGSDAAPQWRFPTVSGELLYAVAAPLNEAGRPNFTQAITLTKEPLDLAPQTLARMAARHECDLRVLIFSQEQDGYIDLLNPEAVYRFIQETHERYASALGDDFKSITGFYTRQPTVWPDDENDDVLRMPWSPILMDSFAQQPGYDLLEWLPALIAELGDDAPRLRQDFWATIVRMTRQGFWEPLHQWSRAAGCGIGGYVRGQQPLNMMVRHQGDAAAVYQMLDLPVVTMPHSATGVAAIDIGRGLHARLAVSIAALQGQSRVMCELDADDADAQAAGDDWNTTPATRLPMIHHLLRQGINSFALPAAFSLHGRDPHLTAPSEQHQPTWTQIQGFAQYLKRSGYLLSHGRPGARVALLWPIRSAWAHHHPRGHRFTRWVEEDLYATALMLDDLHYEFLLLPEDDLIHGQCDKNLLNCGVAQHPFELLILPSVTALSWAAWHKIEEFIEGGGKVACLGLLPRWSEKGRDYDFETHITQYTRLNIGDLYDAYAEIENGGEGDGSLELMAGYPMTRENEAGGRLSCYQPRLNEDVRDTLLRVRKILKESITPDLETQTPDILYTRRVLDATESRDVDTIIAASESVEDEPKLEPLHEEEGFEWDRPFVWDEEAAQQTTEEENPANTLGQETDVTSDETPDEEDESLAGLRLDEATPITTPVAGGDLFFIFNAAADFQSVNLRLHPRENGAPHILDAWSGEIRRWPVWTEYPEEEGGGLSLTLELAAHEAKLLWIGPRSPSETHRAHLERATFVVEDFDGRVATGYARENGIPRVAVRVLDGAGDRLLRCSGEPVILPQPLLLPDTWQSARTGPNVAFAPDWQWQRGRHLPGEARWFGRDNWQPLMPATLDFSGILTFRTQIEIAGTPDTLFLPFDPLDVPAQIFLDSFALEPCAPPYPENEPWNDAGWQWFDLSEVEPGENVISCVVDYRERGGSFSRASFGTPSTTQAFQARLPSPARVLGNFSLTPDFAIAPAESLQLDSGSWHEQGLPFYSGAVDYRQWVKVPPDWERCRIFLEISRTRDVCGLWLNGRACGIRSAAPYRFDITRRLLKGASNEVRLRIWNSAAAALGGPSHAIAPSGLLGPARIVAYPIVHTTIESN